MRQQEAPNHPQMPTIAASLPCILVRSTAAAEEVVDAGLEKALGVAGRRC